MSTQAISAALEIALLEWCTVSIQGFSFTRNYKMLESSHFIINHYPNVLNL